MPFLKLAKGTGVLYGSAGSHHSKLCVVQPLTSHVVLVADAGVSVHNAQSHPALAKAMAACARELHLAEVSPV
jgi:hypothetical protein